MKKIILCLLFIGVGLVNATTKDWKEDCTSREFLGEVARHLYRWHMTSQQIEATIIGNNFEFWVKKLDYELDPSDKSIYQEIILPNIGMRVVVKKTDYKIPELDLVVKGDGYRITSFNTVQTSWYLPKKSQYKVIVFNFEKLKAHLYETRNKVSYPTASLMRKIIDASSTQINKYFNENNIPIPKDYGKIIHVSSLSGVSNEIWVFWESGQLVFRFSSDIDIEKPAMWKHLPLNVDIFELDKQVLVSLTERPGSNAYLTRDAAGRILYNCIIRGKRVDMTK